MMHLADPLRAVRHLSNLHAWLAITAVVVSSTAGDLLLSRAMKKIGDLGDLRRRRGLLFVALLASRNKYFLLGVGCAREGEPQSHRQYGCGLFHFCLLNPFVNYVVSAGRPGARVLACHSTTPRPMIRPGTYV